MWVQIIVQIVTSNMAKALIGALVKKLLDAKGDGVTKDIAVSMLDAIAMSRANNATIDIVEIVKREL